MENLEHEKHELAVQISVLSYDLDVINPTIPVLLQQNTVDMLTAKRDDLLAKIDEQIALEGFYAVPDHMDATWLATLLQTELGSYVDAGEYDYSKAVVAVIPQG
ncbi:hypothetical protein SEA_WENTWORTH_94 [Streptomyces phage Wentworth]|nr:hypothetical protein SEA_WENTWORTH_94 [Streptomyces phage Wentworth]